MVAQLKTRKEIVVMISGCLKQSAAFYNNVHNTLVQCILHVEAHGDTTPLAQLYTGLSQRGTFEKGIAIWLAMFTPIRVNGNGEIKLIKKSNVTMWEAHLKASGGVVWRCDEAEETPFWTLDKVKDAKKVKEGEKFFSIVDLARKQFEKALADDNFAGDPQAVREYLAALALVPKPVQKPERFIQPSNDVSETAPANKEPGFDMANVQAIVAA